MHIPVKKLWNSIETPSNYAKQKFNVKDRNIENWSVISSLSLYSFRFANKPGEIFNLHKDNRDIELLNIDKGNIHKNCLMDAVNMII